MNVHYINILLFTLPLNILVIPCHAHNKNKPSITRKIPTTRLLCECDIYMPNYDNDQEMKKIMENYNRQTSQRFNEYDERMKTTRQKCKERCDKEIQKIILKDKLEKQMEQQLTTLETKINTDDIPTCVCEKSMADKVEKDCLRCGYGLGTVAPTVGLIGSVAVHAWKPLALEATIAAALKLYAGKISTVAKAAGIKAGDTAGRNLVTYFLEQWGVKDFCPEIFKSIGTKIHYTNIANYAESILTQQQQACTVAASDAIDAMCSNFNFSFGIHIRAGGGRVINGPPGPGPVRGVLEQLVGKAKLTAKGAADAKVAATKAGMEATVKTVQEKAIEAASYDWYATIGYSVLAIIIIVLIMVIIYKILRYRRKKKMKKKLQYIKLLEE